MKNESLSFLEIKEENLGYFRPGYFPVVKGKMVPAVICLTDSLLEKETSAIQFVLIKPTCYFKTWEDALTISEKDFKEITEDAEEKTQAISVDEKINILFQQFLSKGYLPLNEFNDNVQFNELH